MTIEFLPWFWSNFWFPAVVLFVVLDALAWVVVVFTMKKIFRRRG